MAGWHLVDSDPRSLAVRLEAGEAGPLPILCLISCDALKTNPGYSILNARRFHRSLNIDAFWWWQKPWIGEFLDSTESTALS